MDAWIRNYSRSPAYWRGVYLGVQVLPRPVLRASHECPQPHSTTAASRSSGAPGQHGSQDPGTPTAMFPAMGGPRNVGDATPRGGTRPSCAGRTDGTCLRLGTSRPGLGDPMVGSGRPASRPGRSRESDRRYRLGLPAAALPPDPCRDGGEDPQHRHEAGHREQDEKEAAAGLAGLARERVGRWRRDGRGSSRCFDLPVFTTEPSVHRHRRTDLDEHGGRSRSCRSPSRPRCWPCT